MDGTKAFLNATKWYVYNSEKEILIKVGYLVDVADKYGRNIILGVDDYHVVEERVEHEDLCL